MYDPSERSASIGTLDRLQTYPLLKVLVVAITSGHVTDTGARVASDFDPVSWTPDGQALLVNAYDVPGSQGWARGSGEGRTGPAATARGTPSVRGRPARART